VKKLLIGSVYSPCDRNPVWLGLQQRFLSESCKVDFDLTVFLNRVDDALFKEKGVTVAGKSDVNQPDMCREHAGALNQLVGFMREETGRYENFLLLDSDAFPFQDNWLERLLAWMKEDDFLEEKLFAAPCRAENLDAFPHPCAFFMRGRFLKDHGHRLDFGPAHHVNFSGFHFDDVGCGNPTVYDGKHRWLPLLRTNVWSPHPVLSAIYGGIFYHHGSGSRPLELRSVALRTYDNQFPRYQHGDTERQLYLEISRNPRIYIRQLLGGQ
jgi:hypothetical protein